MCGNVALISTNKTTTDWKKRSDWLRAAIIADTIRGADGTGLAFVPWDDLGAPDYLKQAVPGPTFLENRRVGSILTNVDKYAVLMGHNRAATKGGVSTKSSHPFAHKHITLCHNGTLTATSGLDLSFDVDSEAICHAFAEKGAGEVIETLKGAYALQWYDAKEKTYNIARNEDRPLAFAFTPKGEFAFVASEAWMIRELAYKYDITLSKDGVWSLNPGHIITFAVDDPKKKDLSKFTSKAFTPYVTPTYTSSYGGGRNNGNFTKATDSSNGSVDPTTTINKLSAKRRELYRKKLDKIGLVLGELIEITDVSFHPYSGPHTPKIGEFGKVEGLYELENNTYVQTLCYSVPYREEYSDLSAVFYGTVVGASQSDGSVYVTVEELEQDSATFMYKGPNDSWVTLQELDKLCKGGCSACKEPIDVRDKGEWVDWVGELPVCTNCWGGGC